MVLGLKLILMLGFHVSRPSPAGNCDCKYASPTLAEVAEVAL